MAQAVYSTRFLSLSVAGSRVSFVCPAGFRAVLRAIDMVYQGGPSAAFGLVQIGGASVTVAMLANLNGNDQLHVQTHQVFEAGDPITISASTGNACNISTSGYLLTLP